MNLIHQHQLIVNLQRSFGGVFDSMSNEALQTMRTLTVVATLIISAAGGGAGMALSLAHFDRPAVKPNSSIFLAMNGGMPHLQADQTEGNSQQAVAAALVSHDVDELKGVAVRDADDRKLIHDQLYKLETENTNRFNLLTTRMDISDAKFNWIVALGGTVLTLISSVGTIITILDQIKRRKEGKSTP